MARKNSRAKTVIFITLIATMNLMGMSYGNWQQGMFSEFNVHTGNIDPCFADKAEVEKDGEFEKIKALIKSDKNKDRNYIKLSGEIESGKDGKFTIDYSVFNNGDLPMVLDEEAFAEINKELLKGNEDGFMLLEGEFSDEVLYPLGDEDLDKAAKGSLTLQLETKKEIEEVTEGTVEGTTEGVTEENAGERIKEVGKDKKETEKEEEFEFEIRIPYMQWTED